MTGGDGADGGRRVALREVVSGLLAAVMFAAIWDQVRGKPLFPGFLLGYVALAGVMVMLYVAKRLDLFGEQYWADLPPRSERVVFGALFFALGFGGVLMWEAGIAAQEPPPGPVPPGYEPGPPEWFWMLLLGIAVVGIAVGFGLVRFLRRRGYPVPPREHLRARVLGTAVGGVAGLVVGVLIVDLVGVATMTSEPLLTALVLVFASASGLGAAVRGHRHIDASSRNWGIALMVVSAALLALGLAGIAPLRFEIPAAAATLGSLAMAIVGTIRYAHHREGSGSRPAEAE